MTQALVLSTQDYPIDLAISAWLDSKVKLSGSAATHRNYSDILLGFRAALQRAGLDLTSPSRDVALAAQVWASRDVHGAKEVGASTFNHKLAVVSSFFTFARKRQLLDIPNPIDLLDRRKVQSYAAATALSTARVADMLRSVDRTTLSGLRDYALLAVGVNTGRRRAELAAMRLGDVHVEGESVTVIWPRAKGGKVMRDRLEPTVGKALVAYLQVLYGDALDTLPDELPVWVSISRNSNGEALSMRSLSNICDKYIGTHSVHSLRHTFAHVMEEQGATVSDIQARLGHSNLATTGRYLTALRSDVNKHSAALASAFGMDD